MFVFFAVDNPWKLPKSTEMLAPSFPGTNVMRTQGKSKTTSFDSLHDYFPVSLVSLSLTSDAGQRHGNMADVVSDPNS